MIEVRALKVATKVILGQLVWLFDGCLSPRRLPRNSDDTILQLDASTSTQARRTYLFSKSLVGTLVSVLRTSKCPPAGAS